ncbi:PAS domain S-box-containing protein [Caulobacter ginsengisoli]|uniref:histidine kinase n=1 Tax=Caulobacter ginsengisoli TaxID=400775 RepID=A0ABU0IXW7_9CAUL|nr:response regulator [Caulobacter ginsengisoli]MDQ0466857.1 PAS domain S-box-containing protein [Caulobacter ginsengisoli]
MTTARPKDDPHADGRADTAGLDFEQFRRGFARIADIARDLAQVPVADVSFVGPRRIWSTDDPHPIDRACTLAGHVVLGDEPVWIADARLDPEFSAHAKVVGPESLRFMAGAPIVLASGWRVGAVCIADTQPRQRDSRLLLRLKDLADLAADECERRLALNALVRTEAEARGVGLRMTAIVDAAPVAVLMTDRQLRIIRVSARWSQETGLSPAMVLGRKIYDCFPGVREDYAAAYEAALKGKGRRSERARLKAADGSTRWLRAETCPWREADGTVGGVLVMTYDVTEMVEALRVAESAGRAKSQFLANMSHEIRTPLNGVMGLAGVLAGTELAPSQRELLDLIQESAGNLESLLSDLLDMAAVDCGEARIVEEPFDIAAIIRAAAEEAAPRAREKHLTFETEIVLPPGTRLRGDAARIRQVLAALLSNAVKFTETGGVLVRLTAKPSGASMALKLAVRDTGCGFDAETAQRLFRRFEQADGSLTRRHGGAGLGLSLARALAEAMGGGLTAEGVPGRGATFTLSLTLPRLEPAVASEIVAPPLAEASDGTLKVLLAEDHPVNRKVVAMILDAAGVELTQVENGAEAVEAEGTGGYDLVLMDMQMPVMDGLTAIRAIRRRERDQGRRATPILTLTANALPEHAEASRQAGADGHLTKPITPDRLIDAMQRVLDGAAAV